MAGLDLAKEGLDSGLDRGRKQNIMLKMSYIKVIKCNKNCLAS